MKCNWKKLEAPNFVFGKQINTTDNKIELL